MKTSLQRWGNSLALRVPSALARELNLTEGSRIELVQEKGTLVIRPLTRKEQLLSLLDQIQDEQLHEEQWAGEASGQEAW